MQVGGTNRSQQIGALRGLEGEGILKEHPRKTYSLLLDPLANVARQLQPRAGYSIMSISKNRRCNSLLCNKNGCIFKSNLWGKIG